MPPDNEGIKIVPFDQVYAWAFASLNYEWIERYFVVEPQDRKILDNPKGNIIDRGGEVFFAFADGNVVGTVALIDEGDDRFELAKMAVSPEFRGRGIGDRLIEACVEHSRRVGKKKIFLLSNTLLKPAINLYRKHGFVETPLDETSPYERVNIRMELAIDFGKM